MEKWIHKFSGKNFRIGICISATVIIAVAGGYFFG